MSHGFGMRLLKATQGKGPVCVGLDPVLERLPKAISQGEPTQRIEQYCTGVLEAVAENVGVVKPQLACFERYGSKGYAVYERVVDKAKSLGFLVVADAKRGDIGISARHYAVGLLGQADAVTVSPYLGADTLEPFVEMAASQQAGLFVLVRTSNPGSDGLQGLSLQTGETVAQAVADMVAQVGADHVDESGYSLVGAVVGATKPSDVRALRERMPEQIFLVPGYGAQGGTAEDVKACFDANGHGALITASRSVIYAFDESKDQDWQTQVNAAAKTLSQEIHEILD